jgi:hypothetical protein
MITHLLVLPGGLHPFRPPIGPSVDSLHGGRQVTERNLPVEKASRPDVEDFLDDRVRVMDGSGSGRIDSHRNAPALSTIGATATASPFRFDDSSAA